jgi:hypothetical protein
MLEHATRANVETPPTPAAAHVRIFALWLADAPWMADAAGWLGCVADNGSVCRNAMSSVRVASSCGRKLKGAGAPADSDPSLVEGFVLLQYVWHNNNKYT